LDTALKQRLIGAAVLVALAVIFLPALVKGPAPDSGVSDVPLKMPDAPAGEMETRELPLAAPGQLPKGGAVGMDATPVDRPAAATTPADAAAVPGQPPADGTTPPATGTPPVDATAPAGALPPTTAAGDYAVHFGAYATQKGADTVVALAKNAGLPAYSETTTVNGKPAFRVRIGPYATRAEAESVRLKALEVRSDVPVRVVALDAEPAPAPAATTAPAPATAAATPVEPPKPAAAEPAKPAPAKPEPKPVPPVAAKPEPKPAAATPAPAKPTPTPPVAAAKPAPAPAKPASTAASAPLTPVAPKSSTLTPVAPKPTAPKPAAAVPAAAKVGFAVQVGAFSDATEAGALREKLRAAGFTAFTETVSTDKGKLVRVRVGPTVDRAAADQLKAQVQAKVGVDGIVRPYP
jgi:cell division septation protein DedD